MLKIGFIDDHESILLGLESYFSSQYIVAFSTTEPKDTFKLLKENITDILVIDIVFPDLNYIEFYVKLRKDYPKIRIISYTSLSNPLLKKSLFKIGVFDIINKNEPLSILESAINRAFRHEVSNIEGGDNSHNLLTKSELKVVKQLASGKTTKEIAEDFNRSYKTIDNHRTNILMKMRVANVSELISKCYQLGLLS